MKSEKDIIINEDIAILEGVTKSDEVKMLSEYTKINNYKGYKAVSQSGQLYEVVEPNLVKPLKQSEAYVINPLYVVPPLIEESTEEVPLSVIDEEVLDQPDIDNNTKEDAEALVEALTKDNELLLAKLEKSNSDLEMANVEIDKLKLELTSINITEKTITLEDVIQFVKQHGYQLTIL